MTVSQVSATVPEFADEVVTRALVRYVEVPGLPGEMALVTLENGLDHQRPSTFGAAGLACLEAALDEIGAHVPQVAAIGVTGKPFVFAVGADLSGVGAISTLEQAREVGRRGHHAFRRLHDSAVPTFAFVNGVAMGGGLELALHCHYRTVSTGAAAIALPECFLGLVPAWGGTQLLPNLIGADGAVTVIIENALNNNRMLKPAQAAKLGMFDASFSPADFLTQSTTWAAAVLGGDITVKRAEIDRGDAWVAALARGTAIADAKLHGAAPAPYRALELIGLARDADLTAGTAAEDEALADLVMGEELRAGLYAFELVQKRAKRPAGQPDKALARPVTKVGIVGAGLMARQLALLFVRRLQVPVVLTDIDAERIERAVAYVRGEVDKLQARGRLSADTANRLKASVTGSLSKEAFADADFVIEAVFEDLRVKQQVFAEVEAVVSPECILATNTSSLPISEMAAGLQHPERVVGVHFFNPVALLPLLEIVRARQTDDATLATAFAVGNALRKSCVQVLDAPAFVVNRLLTRFLGEVTAAIDEGTPFEVADQALAPLGLPLTPLVLLALVGPAVAHHVSEILHEAFPDRFGVSDNLGRLVAAGKTDIYVWDSGRPEVDPEVRALFVQGDRPQTGEQVRDRALSALAEEARLILDEGVVAAPQDIDLCLLLGAGWPFHLGGITPYLDRSGVSERVTGSFFLPRGVASVPQAV
ncbi:MAG: 3-hydroxyacyl-CoA dehydrogenase NAD-binding domain-containing protein [Pseudonocardiales bacterium]